MKTLSLIRAIAASAALTIMIAFSSCSSDNFSRSRAELLGLLGNDGIVAGSVDLAKIYESAGATYKNGEIVLPDKIKRMSGNKTKLATILSELVSAKGVDYRNIAFSVSEDNASVIFIVTDFGKFKSWAESIDMEHEKSGQFDVFTTNDGSVAVVIDNEIARIIICDDEASKNPVELMKRMTADAFENPMSEWKIECLAKGNAAFICDIEALRSLIAQDFAKAGLSAMPEYSSDCKYQSFEMTIDGPSMHLNGQTFNQEGKQTPVFADGTYKTIPSEALALIRDAQIAIAFSLPDYYKDLVATVSRDEWGNLGRNYSDFIENCLSALNSVCISASLNDGASIMTMNPSSVTASAIIDYDKAGMEKAISKISDIKDLPSVESTVAAGWKTWTQDSTFTITPNPSLPDFKIYFNGRDNLAFISTNPTFWKSALKPDSSLKDLTAFMSVKLDKSHPVMLMLGCPFGVNLYFTTYADSFKGDFTLTDCDGLLLETVLDYASRF